MMVSTTLACAPAAPARPGDGSGGRRANTELDRHSLNRIGVFGPARLARFEGFRGPGALARLAEDLLRSAMRRGGHTMGFGIDDHENPHAQGSYGYGAPGSSSQQH